MDVMHFERVTKGERENVDLKSKRCTFYRLTKSFLSFLAIIVTNANVQTLNKQ